MPGTLGDPRSRGEEPHAERGATESASTTGAGAEEPKKYVDESEKAARRRRCSLIFIHFSSISWPRPRSAAQVEAQTSPGSNLGFGGKPVAPW